MASSQCRPNQCVLLHEYRKDTYSPWGEVTPLAVATWGPMGVKESLLEGGERSEERKRGREGKRWPIMFMVVEWAEQERTRIRITQTHRKDEG